MQPSSKNYHLIKRCNEFYCHLSNNIYVVAIMFEAVLSAKNQQEQIKHSPLHSRQILKQIYK